MSFYRKYRPQNLADVVGQDHVVKTLQNALEKGKVSHAYLFAGPRGTGKTSVARILARELGCAELDTVEIDAASHRGIDEVRALREQVQFQPTAGDKKLYILDEAHMLTNEAFNALLKVIEEPPSYAHFVLCTTEPHKVPVTIISRTQRFDFKPGTVEALVKVISHVAKGEGIVISAEGVRTIAEHADGGFRDALSFFEQLSQQTMGIDQIEEDHVRGLLGVLDVGELVVFVHTILDRDVDSVQETLERLSAGHVHWGHLISGLLSVLRDELLDRDSQYVKHDITSLILQVTEAYRLSKLSPIPQLPLEVCIMQWMMVSDTSPSKSSTKEVVIPTGPAQKISSSQAEGSKMDQEKLATSAPKAAKQKDSADQQDVGLDWDAVMAQVKQRSSSLEALLKGGEPKGLQDNILSLGFKYSFHMEKIANPENKVIVEECIQQVAGKSVTITCFLDTSGVTHRGDAFQGKTIAPGDLQDTRSGGGEKKGGNLEQAMRELGGKIIS